MNLPFIVVFSINNDEVMMIIKIACLYVKFLNIFRLFSRTSKINIIPQDDKPLLSIYNFERVQIAPIDGELKVQETSLLPNSLIDEIGTDSLSLTGYNNQAFVFDPDSLVQTIKISVRTVETDQNIINEAISQDKINFSSSPGNDFQIVESNKLIVKCCFKAKFNTICG